MNIDKRGILETEPFSYQITKDKKVRLFYRNKEIKMLSENTAISFISKIENCSISEQQLVMAKITGNFKHGNEKDHKKRNK